MSLRALTWAMDQRPGTVQKKMLLVELANCMNDKTGECCMGIDELAASMVCTTRLAERLLRSLMDMGYARLSGGKIFLNLGEER